MNKQKIIKTAVGVKLVLPAVAAILALVFAFLPTVQFIVDGVAKETVSSVEQNHPQPLYAKGAPTAWWALSRFVRDHTMMMSMVLSLMVTASTGTVTSTVSPTLPSYATISL